MATVNYTVEAVTPDSVVVTWSNLHNGDVGEAFECLGFRSISGTASGTLGSGGTFNLGVSSSVNNPVYTVNSASSLPTNLTNPINLPALARPQVTAGDGTTDISFSFVFSTHTN